MKSFFDTSVLIAAFLENHVHHAESFAQLAGASKSECCCAVHSLAEVYAVMTAMPVRPIIPPEQALLFIEEIYERLTLITLTAEEYIEVVRKTAAQGFSSGSIYDALLLACAAKSRAQVIYTWNLKHFEALAPAMASRIRTP